MPRRTRGEPGQRLEDAEVDAGRPGPQLAAVVLVVAAPAATTTELPLSLTALALAGLLVRLALGVLAGLVLLPGLRLAGLVVLALAPLPAALAAAAERITPDGHPQVLGGAWKLLVR